MRGSRLSAIQPFDPWGDPWCTCPRNKFSLNPYTGCEHRCIYCYASSYVRRFYNCRPKTNLVERVRRDIANLPRDAVIALSNSSDPYPPMEKRLGLTRSVLEVLVERFPIVVITKSDMFLRDLDLLSKGRVAISVTITTLDNDIAYLLEPYAPPPRERLRALREASRRGFISCLRLDPIIPGLNDDSIEELVERAARAGVRHISSSTFKPRYDSWRRFARRFPELAERLRDLYFLRGMRKGNARYLPAGIRRELMERVAKLCSELGLTFNACREGFPELNTGLCDGLNYLLGYSSSFSRSSDSSDQREPR